MHLTYLIFFTDCGSSKGLDSHCFEPDFRNGSEDYVFLYYYINETGKWFIPFIFITNLQGHIE